MAEIHKLTKNGETILPATTTDAVVHPELQTPLTSLINEYNVSTLFPTSGIDGTNKYDLQTAINLLDEKLAPEQKTVGIKVAFYTKSSESEFFQYKEGTTETWEYQGGIWDTEGFIQIGARKIDELESKANQYRGSNTVAAKAGVGYINKIPIEIKAGDIVTVEIVGDDSIFSSPNELNLYFGDVKQKYNAVIGQTKLITANENADYILVNRVKESVIGDGDITLNVGILQYYTREEMDDFFSKQEPLNTQSNLSNDFSLSRLGEKLNIPKKITGYYYNIAGELVENENSHYYDSIDISDFVGNIVIYVDNPIESSSRNILIKDIRGNIIHTISENNIYLQDSVFGNVKAISFNIDGIYQAKDLFVSLSNSAKLLAVICDNNLKTTLNSVSFYKSYKINKDEVVNIPLDIIARQGDIMEICASYNEDLLGSLIYLRESSAASNNVTIKSGKPILHKFNSNSKEPCILNFTQANNDLCIYLSVKIYSNYFYELSSQTFCIYSNTERTKINTEYINYLSCFIKKGNTFSVDINGDDGILSNNLLGSLTIFKTSGATKTIAQSISSVSYHGTFIAEDDIYYIACSRFSSGVIAEGDITITVNNNYISKTLKEQYISPNGNDDNDGSEQKPKLTINSCLQSGANTIIVKSGNYNQRIDLGLTSEKNIVIRNCDINNKVIFRNPNYILASSSVLVSGKVYKCTPMSSFDFNNNNKWLFQDNISDISTLITEEEGNPYQRGLTYRCDSTKIELCTSSDLESAIEEIQSSKENKWYYDSLTKDIYFSSPSKISGSNPLCWSNGNFISGANRSQHIVFENIETRYMVFNVDKLNATIENCSAKYVYGGGAFSYMDGVVKFNRCEAARCFSGVLGDGFNGHASKIGDPFAKTCVCSLIDCWSHDNNDDGYSDHERAETVIRGGLYEYNCKAGVTPSYGSHCNCFNVYSRKNYVGFRYTGEVAEDEGGAYGNITLFNCISENNTRNPNGTSYGYYSDGDGNSMKCIDCYSIGHEIGYFASTESSKIELVNSYSVDTSKTGGTGTIDVKNITIVS